MTSASRAAALRRAVGISAVSALWDAGAGVTATVAGLVVGSLSLVGFGLDCVVDCAASCVLVWRFRSEKRTPMRAEALERTAQRAVGVALLVIGLYVGARALNALATHSEAGTALVGIVITAASAVALPPLALAKRRIANHLGSRALAGDSVLTAMGAALAGAALLGAGATAALGWWWADSVAALGIAAVLGREGARCLLPLHA